MKRDPVHIALALLAAVIAASGIAAAIHYF